MKYLEQRVDELEKEVNLLKAKNKLSDTSYMYNHSNMTLLSESGLGTFTGHIWDSSELEKNPLDTITVNLSSIADDSTYYHPEYPNILGSWDDKPSTWGFNSEFDKMDKDFLEWSSKVNKKPKLNSNLENKIEDKYGEIISTFPIHRHEWEMDGYGYIVENKNGRDIILTDHGNPYISNIKELESLVASYKNIIQKTERAMFLLK
jgi:hypothetical protein